MKIFIYKLTIALIGLFVLFEITIGSKIKEFERNFNIINNKEKIINFGNKLREEINKANSKDKILSSEDAQLLKKFINKINSELKN